VTRVPRYLRAVWAVTSILVVETLVVGVSVLPAFYCWTWIFTAVTPESRSLRAMLAAMAFVPAYLTFAVALVVLSAATTAVFGWRTRVGASWKLSEMDWPLLDWSRYMVSTHVVRVLVGTFFRSSPIWTWYMRLNGARIGGAVYVNSLSISDHNLLTFGDGVVIGEDVHLSGHTVERGVVKTAEVKLGRGVTVGLGSMIGIGVEAGDGCTIGALSVVPKYSKLDAHTTYAGVPARRIERSPAAV
jgi:acetyltransferase-like isoleucine patch superfamily enzyme